MTKRQYSYQFFRINLVPIVMLGIFTLVLWWVVYMRDADMGIFRDVMLIGGFATLLAMVWRYWHWYQLYQQLTIICRLLPEADLRQWPADANRDFDFQRVVTQLQRQLNEEKTARQEDLMALQSYYAMWSHQIKVPLAVLDLMTQTNRLTPQTVRPELQRLNQYLDMMLHYVRLQQTNQDLVLKQLDVMPIVRQVIQDYRQLFIGKHLSVSIPDAELWVVSDEKWLRFVIEQIVMNAVKYTKTGGVTISSADQQLTISDTGIGIASTDLPRLFESGFTGYNGRLNENASGLGLYMVKRVLDNLGHTIRITSIVGQGTTVTIDFAQTKQFLQ